MRHLPRALPRRAAAWAVLAVAALILAACGEPDAGVDDPVEDAVDEATDAAGGDVDEIDDGGAADEAQDALPGLAGDAWAPLAPARSGRTEVGAAAYLDKVWVVGGLGADGGATADVSVYDPAFDEWEPAPALPQAVHHAAVAAHDDALWVLGGYAGDGFSAPTDAVWRFDPATGEWEEGPALPAARAAGAAASDGDRVVYAGGVGPDGLAGDGWALDGGAGRSLGELAQPREHLAAAAGDGRVWLLAGRTGGLETNLARVDLVEGETVAEIGELPTPRGGLTGFFHPAVGACAVGGEAPGGTFAEVECVDSDGEGRTLPSLEQPRHGLGAAVIGDVAYVVMGGPEPGLTVSDAVEALEIDG
jgi:hypothetical protein